MKKTRIRNIIPVLLVCAFIFTTNAWCLNESNSLKVAVCEDNPYYSFEDEDGEMAGLEIDILKEISREIGCDEIEYSKMDDIRQCIDMLEKREVDVILGFPSFYDGDLSSISMSSEIVTVNLCMMAENDIIETINKGTEDKYTAVFEHNTNNYAIVANLGAFLYYVAGSQEDVLDTVLSGKAQVMICDGDCMSTLLSERCLKDNFSIVRNNICTVGYTIALRKGDTTLLRSINEGILKIHISGKYDEILGRWIETSKEIDIQEIIHKFIWIAAALSTAILVYVFLSWRVRSVLKHKVSVMTNELEKNIQQLEYESDLRNQIIEHSGSMMIICDSAGSVELMNSVARSSIGPENRNYNNELIYVLPVIGDLVTSLIQKSGFSELHWTEEQIIPYRLDNATRKSYRCSIENVHLQNYREGFLFTAFDVTKEEIQKQEIIEREKSSALSRLVAGIAHEIKNPLTGIQNFADLIKTEKDNQQFWDYFSEYVPVEISRISRLIESLMDYAKPSKGIKEYAAIAPLVAECTYLTNTAVRSAKIKLEVNVQENLWIYVVRDQIKQVIINIIVNSMEAIDRHRSTVSEEVRAYGIRIQAQRHDGNTEIMISDNGEGMSEDALKSCIDPFFTTKERGTGLGLAISRQFVQENGALMSIDSEINKGTTIRLIFKEAQHEKENINN